MLPYRGREGFAVFVECEGVEGMLHVVGHPGVEKRELLMLWSWEEAECWDAE